MPQLIPAAAGAVASAFSGFVYAGAQAIGFSAATASTISIYAATLSGLGTVAAITVGLGALATPKVPDPESGKVIRRQSRPPRVIAVGIGSRLGSTSYMLRETNGSTLALVIALHDGRLASIDAIYLNDDLVTLDGSGWVQAGADGRYGNGTFVQIKTRLGAATETHYSEMTPLFGALWPTTSRGDGIGSLMMLAKHPSKEKFAQFFPNGEPLPTVVATPVCYDWRQDTTAGGSGSQRRNDETTWQPSGNPVVWMVHHEWFRCGRSWTRCIEPVLADLTAEADYCDVSVAKIGGAEPRYQFGGNYTADTQPQARREAMLAACDGWLSTNGRGHMVMKVGRYTEPTFTLTGDHIEGYEWSAFNPDEENINKLIVSYVDPSKDYTETECDPWVDEDDITATGRERSEGLSLTWVQSHSQARRLAKRKMSRLQAERRGRIITGLYGLNGLGQRYIRVQNPELDSMADVVVEVMGVEFDPVSAQVVFDVILADTAIDAWNPATEEGNAVSGAERPDPEALPAPSITSVTAFFEQTGSGTGVRLNVVGAGPDREDLTWYVRWRVSGAGSWVEGQFADSDPTGGFDVDTGFVPADATLQVQAAYETGGGVLSEWGPATPATVDTSTAAAAPSVPTGLSAEGSASGIAVSWNNPSSANFVGARVWYGSVGSAFGSATDASGLLTASPGTADSFTITGLSLGDYDVWVTAENAVPAASAPAGPVTATVEYLVDLDFVAGTYRIGTDTATDPMTLAGFNFSRASGGYDMIASTLFATDAPRITSAGLLIEGAATNLAVQSQAFDNAAWTKNRVAATANTTAAPDGTTTAETLGNTLTGTEFYYAYQNQSLTNGVTYTDSCFGKNKTGAGWCWLLGPSAARFAWFDLVNQVAGARSAGSDSYSASSLAALANGWSRMQATFTLAGATGSKFSGVGLTTANSVSQPNPGSANAMEIYPWGFQREVGSVATSLIPPGSATREADVLTITLPAGSGSDAIEVTHDGGVASFNRSSLANPLQLVLGAASAGAWVGKHIQRVTVEAA